MRTLPPRSRSLLYLARKGPVRARDLDKLGIPRAYLSRLRDRGVLEQVDRGLYRIADGPVTELSSLADVSKRVPHGIVCLLSALQVHGMTSEVPHAVWVLIERHARLPKVSTPMLEVVRASGAARQHGVESRVVEGVKVQLTSPAKTVADCFRYRRHVGLEVALGALKDYLAKRKGSIDALVSAARADGVYSFMRPYLEALARRRQRLTTSGYHRKKRSSASAFTLKDASPYEKARTQGPLRASDDEPSATPSRSAGMDARKKRRN